MGLGFVLVFIASNFAVYLFCLYCWFKLEGRKLNLKNKKTLLSWLILSVVGSLISMFVPQFLKIFAVVLMIMLINYYFITRNFDKCVAGVIIYEMLSMICELLVVLGVYTFIESDSTKFSDSLLCMSVLSFGVPILELLAMQTKLPTFIYNYLLKTFHNIRKHNLLTYFITIIVLASVFMMLTYMELPSGLVLICNTFLIICFVLVVVKLINAKEKNKKILSKYETSIASLKEYEDIMDKYRVTNHENKNQLLTIRNMVKTNDKKTLNYIDKILEHKIKDNEKVFSKTAKIPEGGLRAIIYSKVCRMEELKINYTLEISNDVKTNTLIDMDEDTILNICKILGVFLDNSIEAVQNLEKKDIIIELFMLEKNLCIDITNNYEGVLEIAKISQKKYTTKGKDHGYGLSLVSEIIKSDSNLCNEKIINKDNFTQRLIIKL